MNTPPTATPKDWALVTGGSHGIGRALAISLLRRGCAIAVVALPDGNLEELEAELRATPGATYALLGTDLTATEAIPEITAWLEGRGITVRYLVNNAGFGRGGLIEHTPWIEYLAMLQLNTQVLVGLTLALLPHLKRTRGGVLNMSSMEATLPLPYKTVYTGTKAFVYNYSLALREELRYYGVSVSVLCPGPVITNEDGMKRVEAMGRLAKVLITLPEDFADDAVGAFLAGRDVIRPGWLVRTILRVAYLIPRRTKMRLLERIFSKYREEAPAARAEPKVLEEVISE